MQVLEANAWHHRTDAISSILAFIGVGGEMLGVPGLDALAGIAVAGIIGWAGFACFFFCGCKIVTNSST